MTQNEGQEQIAGIESPMAAHALVAIGQYRIYDPTLGHARDPAKAPPEVRMIPGYDLWPVDMRSTDAVNRIITLGGSTTDWFGECRWAMHLANAANQAGFPTLVMNGGCGGYSSHQELLKLYRDSPALQPTLVVSFGGINDFVEWSWPKHPMLNQFQVHLAKVIGTEKSAFDGFTLGLPNDMKPWEFWLRNGRAMRFMAEDMGANFIQCLQPTMGTAPYNPTPEEQRILDAPGQDYYRVLDAFYSGCRASVGTPRHDHLVDLTRIFTGMSDLFHVDSRHADDRGNQIIAKAVFDELVSRDWLKR